VLNSKIEDVVKSSEIEAEILDKDIVRSSIARRLGMDIGALATADRHIEGVVEMILSTSASARSSTDGWNALRVSSPRPNGRLLQSHRRTRHCAILPILSNGASSFETLVADAARVTRWPRWNEQPAAMILHIESVAW